MGTAGKIPGLDGLRALACLLVIVWHLAENMWFPRDALGFLRPLVMTGWSGVDLFFALSGFLITSLILKEEARNAAAGRTATFSLANFYMRRFLRILPAFYCVLLLNLLVFGALARLPSATPLYEAARQSPAVVVPYAAFYNNYVWPPRPPGAAYGIQWSLCVEEHFYLTYPALLLLVRRRGLRLALAAAVCLAVPLLRAFAASDEWYVQRALYMESHFRIDSILWGGLAALAFEQLARRTFLRRALLLTALFWVLAFAWRQEMQPGAATRVGVSLGYSLLASGGALLVAEAAAAPGTALVRLLELAPMRWLGRVSYGIYLLHVQAIDVSRWLAPALFARPTALEFWAAFGLAALVSLLMALAMYETLEAPILKLKERFGSSSVAR